MRIFLFLKVSVLALALVAVLYSIRHLNTGAVNRVFAALGVEPGTATSPGFQPANRSVTEGHERMNICPTRIHSIEWKDGRKVEETRQGLKLKWVAIEPASREISYLDVEKWLSAHCQIHVVPTKAPQATFDDSITIRYIDGTEARMLRSGGDLFRVGHEVFRSEDFRDALEELKKIALF